MGKKKRALKAELDATRALLHHRWLRMQTLYEQLEQANKRIAELERDWGHACELVQQLRNDLKEARYGVKHEA